MKFTSQICTSRSQSERLLALGLKKETADCVMMYYDGWHIGEAEHFDFDKDPVEPAWSLHRLIEMMPNEIIYEDYSLILALSSNSVYYADNEYAEMFKYFDGNLYKCVIKCIEWLIKEGYFNKEYLEG